MSLERLMKGARTAVECLGIRNNEKVIIITDEKMPREISEALFQATKEVDAECAIKMMEPLKQDAQEPSKEIAELMKTPNALFLVTSRSLSHTKTRKEASKTGVRIASMPKVTEFSFTEGGLTADYQRVKELTDKMYKELKDSRTIRVTSDNGTDVVMSVENKEWMKDDGIIHEKGDWNNLPAGEVCTGPVEGTTQGVVVIDKMGFGDKIKWIVKDGYAEKIEGSELLKNTVNKIGLKARNIAEIGIGTNPKAKIIGNVLENEKVFGTVHIALGNNLSFGGSVDVPFHRDGIILKPTLEVDEKVLIKKGKWTV